MLLKALDLLRVIGWGVISFIFSLIDSLFEIIKEMGIEYESPNYNE